MESLYHVDPPHSVYEPPSLPLSSLEAGAKRGQSSDRVYGERAKKPKISQANPEVDSINSSSIFLLPNPGTQIDPMDSATISEDQPHAGLQAMSALEESVLSAFEYSDNVVVLGEKKFPVPMGSEINSFLKFKRAHPDMGGRVHILTYPQRAMPVCWNAAVQKPSDRILLAFYWFVICTGKSLISETNPWLDFVIFQNSPGIRWAILCLAAMHLHDHAPDRGIGDRVIRNNAFGYRAIQLHKRTIAYLRNLLSCKQDGSSSEIISLIIILSTIDANEARTFVLGGRMLEPEDSEESERYLADGLRGVSTDQAKKLSTHKSSRNPPNKPNGKPTGKPPAPPADKPSHFSGRRGRSGNHLCAGNVETTTARNVCSNGGKPSI
ncbi:unnamed protein product [Fusarium equiseti]|uniref:Uncharacterized protein n=1 Tax=Fusarium equiseti TaxID=61235 RepID=A0A8J2NGK0_FUSEQ|nr:unnamed protein product [Fusarium equiseti]